jgi:ligand-binding sensor domain-containing protein
MRICKNTCFYKKPACLVGWIVLFHLQVIAQHPLYFENYTSEKGLSQNSCFAITQDAEGFMWFGTQDGLNRYDGKEFKKILPQTDIGKNIPSNYITSLFYDKEKNMLWVATQGGVCIYESTKEGISKVSSLFPYAKELEHIAVKKIISFSANQYWIISYSNGLYLLNSASKSLTHYFDEAANKEKVASIIMHKGQLYVGLLQQLYRLNSNGNNYSPQLLFPGFIFPEIKEMFSYNNQLWLGTLDKGCFYINDFTGDKKNIYPFPHAQGGVGCFTTDASNNLWIGTRGNGIVRYNGTTNQHQEAVNNRYDNRSIGKNFVLSLFKDRQDIVWCGLSGGGVAKYDSFNYRFQNISNDPMSNSSLPDNMVFDIYQAKNGNYYVGTQNKGLTELDPNTGLFTTFYQSSTFGAISNTIYDITEDNEENLWVASWGGLMKLDLRTKQITFKEEKNLLLSKKLYGIHKLNNADSLFICGENGAAFFSLRDNKWKTINKDVQMPNAFIGRYIYEDDKNILWICTTGEGLVKYDYKNNSMEVIETVKKQAGYIRHLLPDGSLFYLSTDNGILLYNYTTGKVERRISINNGYLSNVCYAIQKDEQGFYWVSSNTGLHKINPTDHSVHHYDLGDGLAFLEFNTACAVKKEDGSLLFGGTGGITHFNPLLLKENNFSPAPIITSIAVNDTILQTELSLSLTKELSLNYHQNFITIHFAVNNFSNQTKNRFAYQLVGLDKNWIYNGNKNSANYTSIPSGTYFFQLKSANSDGKWCDTPVELKIIIHPPWWQTGWFQAIATALIGGIVFFFVRRRIQVVRRQAELKQKIAETEMAALRVQMNPHFIFNSLNSINSFIVENKTHLASDYLTKFSRLIRLILDNSKNEIITLEKELETLKLYLLMERLRFQNKFDYQVFVDKEIDDEQVKIPPMIIQPYAENAIWHGLMHQPGNGKLDIRVKKSPEGEGIQVVVEDNGIGRARAAELKSKNTNTRKSYGMQITSERIKHLNKNNTVEISDIKNGEEIVVGTRVTINLYHPY